ncbi:MAG TPA: hypothetical protein VGI19_19665, partial [Candidatus Cybelea sp.]
RVKHRGDCAVKVARRYHPSHICAWREKMKSGRNSGCGRLFTQTESSAPFSPALAARARAQQCAMRRGI